MKPGWEVKALGEVCEISSGGTPSKARDDFWLGDIPWVSPKDMKAAIITDSEDHISEAAVKESATRLIKTGALLLVVRSGILARTIPVALAGRDLTINQDIKALQPSKRVFSNFLAYFLEARETDLLSMVTRGATVHKLDTPAIKSLPIPLPPIDEQKRIVEVLDAAFEGLSRARAHTETNLQNARELFGTTIQSLLNHEEDDPASVQTSLGEVCEIYAGAGFPDKYQGNSSGDFPFFKVGDMNKEGNELALRTANNYISEEVRKMLGAKVFKPNCIVFPKVGGAIATNKKRKIVVPSCVDNNVMGLWPIPDRIDAEYLSWWLQGFDIYEFSNKAALPSITKTTVSDWPLILPPMLRQREIATELQILWCQSETLQSHYRAKLADLDALRQALLQKAFAGELT